MLIARDKDGNIYPNEVKLIYRIYLVEVGERWNSNDVHGGFFSKEKAIEYVLKHLDTTKQTNHYSRIDELNWEHNDDYITISELNIE